LIQEDLRGGLDYYEHKGGTELADRFFAEAESTVIAIRKNPRAFHTVDEFRRRANFRNFPYHFIFEIQLDGIRITFWFAKTIRDTLA